jgi:hypothetical protein
MVQPEPEMLPPPRFASGLSLPETLRSQVRVAIEREPAATTNMSVRLMFAAITAASMTIACVLIASQIVYERQAAGLFTETRSTAYLSSVLILLLGLTFAATSVAMVRGRRGFGSNAVSLLAVSTLVIPVYAALVLLSPVHAHDPVLPSVAISPWGARCFAVASITGMLVLASFTLALRRSVPVGSKLRGAAVGAAAGTWAGLSVFAFCPSGDSRHILLGHVLPLLVLSLLGVVAIPRMLRP